MYGNTGIYPKMELGELALIQKPDFLKTTWFFFFLKKYLKSVSLGRAKTRFLHSVVSRTITVGKYVFFVKICPSNFQLEAKRATQY
jgi:hypothetical protein